MTNPTSDVNPAEHPAGVDRRLGVGAALCGMLAAVSIACAVGMRVAHLAPRNLLGNESYGRVSALHGVSMLVLFPASLLLLAEWSAPARERPASWLGRWTTRAAWISLAINALVSLASVLLVSDAASPAYTFELGVILLINTLLVAVRVLVRWREVGWSLGAVGLCVAAIVQFGGLGLAPLGLLGWELGVFNRPFVFVLQALFAVATAKVTALAALAVVSDFVGERRRRLTRGVLLAILFVTMMAPPSESVFDGLLSLLAIACAAVIAAQIGRDSWKVLRVNPGRPLYAALAALTFFQALLVGRLLRTLPAEDIVHDTYAVVAAFHLDTITVCFALIASFYGASRLVEGRAGSRWSYAGAALSFVGSEIFHFSLLLLGTRGMPRRYASYLPEFRPIHVVATAGSFLLAAGLLIGAAGAIRSKRAARKAAPAAS